VSTTTRSHVSSLFVLAIRGRPLSIDFLRKPPKRLYPDYYELINHPIALDDIKKQLDTGGYSSLEAVKNDFELCFSNAKQYNQTESIIFQDAKELLVSCLRLFWSYRPLIFSTETRS
jgi:hypothetical protein